ncbi:DUF3656 domain-containing protein, partial [Acinetobacter baumannii]|uniref:DUF3656 domain-containing protein n=1 Tax=Acinetobacter baumannii TaxID=470 RepID=UPI0031F3F8B9
FNDRVFRTLDSRLMSYAQQFYGPDAKKRIPVDAVVTARLGQPMTVTLTDDIYKFYASPSSNSIRSRS